MQLIAVMSATVAGAKGKFDAEARKLGQVPDLIRENAFIMSALTSVLHNIQDHADQDDEPAFRARILQQDIGDFHVMMLGYSDRQPSCRQCKESMDDVVFLVPV